MSEPGFIAAALKWTDLRPDVDPLAGTVHHDGRAAGFSLADAAALEWALRLGESWQLPVTAITAGPPEAQAVLRDAAAFGPRRLVFVTADHDAPSEAVASVLAPLLAGAAVVCCGDYSADRGSGSVPAFLAHHLEAAQALGLTGLTPGEMGCLAARRRLDGGRREHLGAAARHPRVRVMRTAPYRPRPKMLPPPRDVLPRARLLALTGALTERTPPRLARASCDEAADELIGYLKDRGYLT